MIESIKYLRTLLILVILTSCKAKMLDINENYILYLKDFGEDPILINDNTFKPPNKNLLFIYPKRTITYENRNKSYTTSDNKLINLKIKISYRISDPIEFYHNDIEIDSLGYKVSWSIREDIDNFFYQKTFKMVKKEIIENHDKINEELTKYIINNSPMTYLIDEKIEGLDIISMQIIYEDAVKELDQRPLLEKLKETMMEKS